MSRARPHRAAVAVALPAVVLGAAAWGAVWTAAPALAAPPGPSVAYQQTKACVSAGPAPKTVSNGVGWAQQALQYTQAWQYSRGDGVKVAVIDTGVNPGPEFGNRLVGLADLVQPAASDAGLDDCDGHGTLVAGILAAAPDAVSGFAGVAPGATVMSIRQSSDDFAPPQNGSGSQPQTAGTRDSLAVAIDYAVAQGAKVINISETDCQVAGTPDSAALDQAVQSAVRNDVVIVAAAGNLSGTGACAQQNSPGQAPVTVAQPADLPGVLAVAAVDETGAPASFSLAGPWVGIAAPGTDIVSSNPYRGRSGQVDSIVTQKGAGTIQGTSFAAPYVAGVAALVRARFPSLTAAQVINRIEATASHPAAANGRNDAVGYGMVDPVAALTAIVPGEPQAPADPLAAHPTVLAHLHQRPAPTRPRTVALSITGGAVALLIALAIGRVTRRTRRRAQAHPGP